MINKTDNTGFISDFNKIVQSAAADNPRWLSEYRKKHSNRIINDGLPSVKDEEWKYTNVSSIKEGCFKLAEQAAFGHTKDLKEYLSDGGINIVLVNGILSKELSDLNKLPKGVLVLTLSEALKQKEETLKEIIAKFEEFEQTSTFTSINGALNSGGTYIHIAKNAVVTDLIHVVHVTSTDKTNTLVLPKTIINCETSSEANILESHICFNTGAVYLAVSLTDIYMAENAVLHYTKAQDESKNAYHIGQTRIWQERNSNFDGFSQMTGAKITRNNLDIIISGEGSNANLNALYSVCGTQHVDNHTAVDHRVENCTSNQLYKGILNDKSRAVFNGKIFVKPEAQRTNSYQLNKNLLLGAGCRVDTKPQLEIFADDVKCTHGATIGQLNRNEIFYLQTRNISKTKAKEMLSRGFAQDALKHISNGSVRQKLQILLEPSFAAI